MYPQIVSENITEEASKRLLDVELLTAPGTTKKVVKTWNKNSRVGVRGFRPGKAPKEVVERYVGKNDLYFSEMVQQYQNVREQQGYHTITDPDLTEWNEQSDGSLKFRIKAELLADFNVSESDYLNLEVEIEEVSDEKAELAYEKFLQSMEKQFGSYKPVDREAKNEDFITLNLTTTVDGAVFPGLTVQSRQLQLTETTFGPELFNTIVGTKPDEEKTADFTFSSEKPHKDLKDKKANLTFSLEAIKELVFHPRNDELARQTKMADSLEELRAKCIEEHKKTQTEARSKLFELASMEAVMKKINLELPQAMVNNELTSIVRWRIQMFEKVGMSKEAALKDLDFKLLNAQAKNRLAAALIFDKLYRNQIFKLEDVTQEEIDQLIVQKSKEYDTPEEDLRNEYKNELRLISLKKEILYDRFVAQVVKTARPVPIKNANQTQQ